MKKASCGYAAIRRRRCALEQAGQISGDHPRQGLDLHRRPLCRDSDEFHFARGRADDLIKISGQWVYPLEVELCLAQGTPTCANARCTPPNCLTGA